MINLDKSLIIQAINFLLLLILLYKLAYRPLLATLEGRASTIKRQLEEAALAREEAKRLTEEYRAKILAAHQEAQAITARAVKEAQDEQRKLLEGARAEAERLVSAARAEITQDVNKARQELRREIGTLAVEIAERLVKKSLREEDHRKIIQESMSRLERIG